MALFASAYAALFASAHVALFASAHVTLSRWRRLCLSFTLNAPPTSRDRAFPRIISPPLYCY